MVKKCMLWKCYLGSSEDLHVSAHNIFIIKKHKYLSQHVSTLYPSVWPLYFFASKTIFKTTGSSKKHYFIYVDICLPLFEVVFHFRMDFTGQAVH